MTDAVEIALIGALISFGGTILGFGFVLMARARRDIPPSPDPACPIYCSFHASPGFLAAMNRLATEANEPPADTISKAVALLSIARDAQKNGRRLVTAEIVEDPKDEIVGF